MSETQKENFSYLLKTDDSNLFKDCLIKMKFSKAVLSRDSRILKSLKKGPVWESRLCKKSIILRTFFCNKIIILMFCTQTGEAYHTRDSHIV